MRVLTFDILYKINQRDRSNPKKEGFLLGKGFRLRKMGFKIQVQKYKKNTKVQKKRSLVIKKGGGIFVYFLFLLPWRHGRVVRRGTANPFSPVQIRVSPDQQKTRNTLFCFADILSPIETAEEKDS